MKNVKRNYLIVKEVLDDLQRIRRVAATSDAQVCKYADKLYVEISCTIFNVMDYELEELKNYFYSLENFDRFFDKDQYAQLIRKFTN